MKKITRFIVVLLCNGAVQGQSSWEPAAGSTFQNYCNWCVVGNDLWANCGMVIAVGGGTKTVNSGGHFPNAVINCGNNPITITNSALPTCLGGTSSPYTLSINKTTGCLSACDNVVCNEQITEKQTIGDKKLPQKELNKPINPSILLDRK